MQAMVKHRQQPRSPGSVTRFLPNFALGRVTGQVSGINPSPWQRPTSIGQFFDKEHFSIFDDHSTHIHFGRLVTTFAI